MTLLARHRLARLLAVLLHVGVDAWQETGQLLQVSVQGSDRFLWLLGTRRVVGIAFLVHQSINQPTKLSISQVIKSICVLSQTGLMRMGYAVYNKIAHYATTMFSMACLLLPTTILQGTVQGERRRGRGNDGKTTSKRGLALNGISYYGKPRRARSGGSWL